MSIKAGELLEAYAKFLADQNREDHFSKKLKELYDKSQSAVSNLTNDQKDKLEIFFTELKKTESSGEEEQVVTDKKLLEFLDKLKQTKEFMNIMPYFLDDKNENDFITINDIEDSYLEFAKLAKKLFPNDFTDKNLKCFFFSLFSFKFVNPKSTGLYNIDVLEKIFVDLILNYNFNNLSNFRQFFDGYFKEDRIGFKTTDFPLQKDTKLFEKQLFLNFNCDLWFKKYEEYMKKSGVELGSAYLDFVGFDSFGYFAMLPDTEDNKQLTSLGTIFSSANTLTLVNKNRLRCFLFPKVSMAPGASIPIFSSIDTRLSSLEFGSIARTQEYFKKYILPTNPGIKIFYNINPNQNFSVTATRNGDSTLNYFNPLIEYPDSYFAGGGSSKNNKMKGGSVHNIFDKNPPSVVFDRPQSYYDPSKFYECIRHLKTIGNLNQLKSVLNQYISLLIAQNEQTKYPVVFSAGIQTDRSEQHLGNLINPQNTDSPSYLTYTQIRFLFLFSSIFTTFIKLFVIFFNNLIKIYSLIITFCENSQRRNGKNKNKNTEYWLNQIDKFTELQKSIKRLKLILEASLITKENKSKFIGFNLDINQLFLNKEQSNIKEAIDIQFNFYFTVLESVYNGFIKIEEGGQQKYSLKSNIFLKTLKQFSILFQIDLGGMPLISDKIKTQQSMLESYKYFVRYVYSCQKTFLKYIIYHNSEKNEKIKKNKIQNINSNVKREVQNLSTKSDIKDKCKLILRKVLEKFIKTLQEINYINSRSTNNSSPLNRGRKNNSNSKTKELKQKLGEFKIYIAIMEASIKEELRKLNSKMDTQTLYLFMMGRFNNFSSLLEYVILNIAKNKTVNNSLNEMDIKIDVEKEISKEELERVFILLLNQFFNFKPDLNKNKILLLQNTGFYYTGSSFENIEWWVQKMRDFQDRDSGKRLFILGTIRRFGITNKIGIDDIVLLDVESCALVPEGEEIPTKKFLDIDYTIDKTGIIKEMRYNPAKNTIINLTPFLRYIREGYARVTKKSQVSRVNRDGELRALIREFEYAKPNAKNNSQITTIGNLVRLLKGKLKNSSGIEIKPVILQGATPKQLSDIIISRILSKKSNNTDYSSNKLHLDYQLIRIDKNSIKNSNLFRRFLSIVLFSPPESYESEDRALKFNLFNLFQVGLSSKFFKFESFGKGSLVIDFFKALEPENLDATIDRFRGELLTARTQNNKVDTFKKFAKQIAEEMKLINQQELQKLLEERETKYYNVNNNRKTKKENPEEELTFSGRGDSQLGIFKEYSSNNQSIINTTRRLSSDFGFSPLTPISRRPQDFPGTANLSRRLSQSQQPLPTPTPIFAASMLQAPVAIPRTLANLQKLQDRSLHAIYNWIVKARSIHNSVGLDLTETYDDTNRKLTFLAFKENSRNNIVSFGFYNNYYWIYFINTYFKLEYLSRNNTIRGENISGEVKYTMELNNGDLNDKIMTFNIPNGNKYDLVKKSNDFYEFQEVN
jgi:hypothetical protein